MAKKIKKLLTLEQLVQFCETNKFYNFNSQDTGYTLSVQVPGNLNFSNEEDEDLLYTTVKVCHTLLNRNGSYISEKNMKKNMHTLKYKPLLASIIEDENGELDFNGHDMEFNDDGTINYIEKQIGTFTIDEPYLEYDKEQDKTYVMATAVIPREYTAAASIIERKNGTKVSCELRINEMQYNAKEKYLELTDFVFSGVCCLGESVGEGMLGSRLDITDFSTENNSIQFEENNKLIETLEKLNSTLSKFNIDHNQGKEDDKVAELEKFEKVVEEVTETIEEVNDEVAEEVTEESTEEVAVTEEMSEETTEETPDVVNEEVTEDSMEQFADKMVRTFEISHEDVRYALYNLLDSFAEMDNDWYWIANVYDSYFVYENWDGTKVYRQSYAKDGNNVLFDGERVELFKELLTASEKAELEIMRSNYAAMESQLKEYQLKEEIAQKDALFTSEDYSAISDKEEFKALAENHAEFSVDELKSKLDSIILDYAKKGGLNFSAETEKKPVSMTRLPIQANTKKQNRYGSLFSK